jgi:hypothetical protein
MRAFEGFGRRDGGHGVHGTCVHEPANQYSRALVLTTRSSDIDHPFDISVSLYRVLSREIPESSRQWS